MSCRMCGAETYEALTPSGRCVELDVDPVWVAPGHPWPLSAFIVGVMGGDGGPMVPAATPALELLYEPDSNGRSGPFRTQHFCPPPVRFIAS